MACVLLNSIAEMCAGSLAPGCRILDIFAARSQVCGAHGCHLACLVALLWRPGGPWNEPGTIQKLMIGEDVEVEDDEKRKI